MDELLNAVEKEKNNRLLKLNNVNKNFISYFYLNVSIIMLDSEFMNLQDDFRHNNNFSCWISDSLIKICLVLRYAKPKPISKKY